MGQLTGTPFETLEAAMVSDGYEYTPGIFVANMENANGAETPIITPNCSLPDDSAKGVNDCVLAWYINDDGTTREIILDGDQAFSIPDPVIAIILEDRNPLPPPVLDGSGVEANPLPPAIPYSPEYYAKVYTDPSYYYQFRIKQYYVNNAYEPSWQKSEFRWYGRVICAGPVPALSTLSTPMAGLPAGFGPGTGLPTGVHNYLRNSFGSGNTYEWFETQFSGSQVNTYISHDRFLARGNLFGNNSQVYVIYNTYEHDDFEKERSLGSAQVQGGGTYAFNANNTGRRKENNEWYQHNPWGGNQAAGKQIPLWDVWNNGPATWTYDHSDQNKGFVRFNCENL